MLLTTAALSFLGIVAASPIAAYDTPDTNNGNYPVKYISKGFNLVVNVTDPSRDFEESVHNKFLTALHSGLNDNLVGVAEEGDQIPVFYQNGTEQDRQRSGSRLAADLGNPPSAFGFSLQSGADSSFVSTANLSPGPGKVAVALTHEPVPYAFLNLSIFAICNQPLPIYQGMEYKVLRQFRTKNSAEMIPNNCVPVTIIPQCAVLEDLPKGSRDSHDLASDSECYADVSSIEWSEYASFDWNDIAL